MDALAISGKVVVPVTVLGGLEAAFRAGSRQQENLRRLEEFVAEPFVQIANVTQNTARIYGELFAALRRAGTPIPTNDVWIAALAVEAGAELLTFDRDFDSVRGLSSRIFT